MKKQLLFAIAPVMVLVACSKNELNDNLAAINQQDDLSNNVVVKEHISPLELLKNERGAVLVYSFTDYPSGQCSHIVSQRDTDANTFMFNENQGIRVKDSYRFESKNNKNICHIRRNADFVHKNQDGKISIRKNAYGSNSNFDGFNVSVTTDPVDSIYFIRPFSTICNPIPMCYYDNMILEWNPESHNPSKILIVAEWNGITMDGSNYNSTITHVEEVDDDGIETLDYTIFDGMPDEALVHLWLVRVNVVNISYNNETNLSLIEALEYAANNPEDYTHITPDYPEIIPLITNAYITYGAVGHMPIYLIRNLMDPVP